MDLKDVRKYTKGKLGIRVKQERDDVLIYANVWTLIVDINKRIKFKLNMLNKK